MSFKYNINNSRGFTLVEIMIVVAIIGILAAVALPAYQRHILATHKKAAIADILALQQELERSHVLNNGAYVLDTTVQRVSGSPPRYNLAVAIPAADNGQTYTITATPTASQAGEECGSLRVNNDDIREVSQSGGSWSVDGSCF